MEPIILIAVFCMVGHLIGKINRLRKKLDNAFYILSEGIGNNDRLMYEKLNDIERSIHDEKNFT